MNIIKIVTTSLIAFMMIVDLASCMGKKGVSGILFIMETVYVMSLISIWG